MCIYSNNNNTITYLVAKSLETQLKGRININQVEHYQIQ